MTPAEAREWAAKRAAELRDETGRRALDYTAAVSAFDLQESDHKGVSLLYLYLSAAVCELSELRVIYAEQAARIAELERAVADAQDGEWLEWDRKGQLQRVLREATGNGRVGWVASGGWCFYGDDHHAADSGGPASSLPEARRLLAEHAERVTGLRVRETNNTGDTK